MCRPRDRGHFSRTRHRGFLDEASRSSGRPRGRSAFAAEGSGAFLRAEAGNSHLLDGAIGYDFNEHTGLSLDVNHIRPQVFGGTIRVTTATLGFEYRF